MRDVAQGKQRNGERLADTSGATLSELLRTPAQLLPL
jgi:hypothetical protein